MKKKKPGEATRGVVGKEEVMRWKNCGGIYEERWKRIDCYSILRK